LCFVCELQTVLLLGIGLKPDNVLHPGNHIGSPKSTKVRELNNWDRAVNVSPGICKLIPRAVNSGEGSPPRPLHQPPREHSRTVRPLRKKNLPEGPRPLKEKKLLRSLENLRPLKKEAFTLKERKPVPVWGPVQPPQESFFLRRRAGRLAGRGPSSKKGIHP